MHPWQTDFEHKQQEYTLAGMEKFPLVVELGVLDIHAEKNGSNRLSQEDAKVN